MGIFFGIFGLEQLEGWKFVGAGEGQKGVTLSLNPQTLVEFTKEIVILERGRFWIVTGHRCSTIRYVKRFEIFDLDGDPEEVGVKVTDFPPHRVMGRTWGCQMRGRLVLGGLGGKSNFSFLAKV